MLLLMFWSNDLKLVQEDSTPTAVAPLLLSVARKKAAKLSMEGAGQSAASMLTAMVDGVMGGVIK